MHCSSKSGKTIFSPFFHKKRSPNITQFEKFFQKPVPYNSLRANFFISTTNKNMLDRWGSLDAYRRDVPFGKNP